MSRMLPTVPAVRVVCVRCGVWCDSGVVPRDGGGGVYVAGSGVVPLFFAACLL